MQVGDIVTLKPEWQIKGVYYGFGVITSITEGEDFEGTWKTLRVQWNNDFSYHTEGQLELVSESR